MRNPRKTGLFAFGYQAGASGEGAIRNEPLVAKFGNACDPLVVAVVVNESDARLFCRAGQKEIGGWNPTVIAAGRERQLRPSGTAPELGGHRYRLEDGEALGDFAGAGLVGGKAGQLEDDQVADEDLPRFDGGVEPGRELGEAAIADPGPRARVEESRSIELRQLQVGHDA